MVFTCMGFCNGTKGLFLAAITEALSIKRSLFSINDSCRFVSTAIINLFFGALVARFGARKLIAAGFLSLVTSMLIYSFSTSVPMFCIGGVFLGLGFAWTSTTIVGYVVDRWCPERRGTIMGLILAASGLGGAIAAQIISPIIYNGADQFGFRTAYRVTALIVLCVGIVVVALFRDKRPADSAMSVTAAKKKPRKSSWEGLPFGETIRKPYFYAAAICIFFTGMALQSVSGVSSAHLRDVGFQPSFVASVVSVHSLILAFAKFFIGIFFDKNGLRKTLLICYAAGIVMISILAVIRPTPVGSVFAFVYGAISSFALPLETIMLPLIAADLFGEKSFAKMLGIFVSINTAGYALGTPLTNLIYDQQGTYRNILMLLAVVLVVVAVSFQLIISAALRARVQTPAAPEPR